jgi:hypothetical protein
VRDRPVARATSEIRYDPILGLRLQPTVDESVRQKEAQVNPVFRVPRFLSEFPSRQHNRQSEFVQVICGHLLSAYL